MDATSSAMLFILWRALGHASGLLTGAGVIAAVDFNRTITLGSVLVAFVIIAISGVFTIRSKIAGIWRQEAEGERARASRLEESLVKERSDRVQIERQQQELRHDLKGEVVALKAQLKAVEARTDLTAALEAIRQMNVTLAEQLSESIVSVLRELAATSERRDAGFHSLLTEIRDKLPNEPISVHEVNHDDETGERR